MTTDDEDSPGPVCNVVIAAENARPVEYDDTGFGNDESQVWGRIED